jgi:hypothetical protein
VPAAAVIPAPIAYIKVVAVKKLVVGFLACQRPARAFVLVCRLVRAILPTRAAALHWVGGCAVGSFTLKKLECSKQAYRCEYISME